MILEGIVTTLDPAGMVNIAPMGPHVEPTYPASPLTRFELRPFPTSRTFANLCAHPEGVLHVVDDVLLLAQAAIGLVEPMPDLLPAQCIRGLILRDACRAYEFRIGARDVSEPRARFHAQVLATHRQRDFFGFNRAMHAVVEAAILATRLHLLPRAEIEAEYNRLAVLVDKTGGPREREAFALLRAHLSRWADQDNDESA
jgi:hypothetical protein